MKTYKNPINKTPTVEIPLWQYTDLVRKAAVLDTALKMIGRDMGYSALDMLKLYASSEGEAE